MSAQFPNVPDVPGVPAVARAGGQLQAIANGAGNALAGANRALEAVNAANFVVAGGALNTTISSAQGALAVATPIFAAGSEIVGSLSGTVANANSALVALSTGDINGAVASIEQTVEAAERAVAVISNIISPPVIEPLAGSGAQVNADTASQWGLFTQDGADAALADNITAFENTLEARISDYPVENGGFGSYNKVIVPYDIRLMMTRGGSVDDRQEFFKAITDAWASTELFNVVTPEAVYLDVNVVGVRRQVTPDRGLGLMALDVSLRQVRQTATITFTQTAQPSGSGQVNNGAVQTQAPAVGQPTGAAR